MTLDELLWHSKKLYDQLMDEKKARDAVAAKQRTQASVARARSRVGRH